MRVELTDPALEGTAERIGTEDSYKLMWRRAGYVRLVVARVKYRVGDGDAATIATTEVPRELITQALAAPSLLAHIASDKFCDGLPLNRQEDRFARLGARIDRGTMGRWLEDLGMAAGATVVTAMRDDAAAGVPDVTPHGLRRTFNNVGRTMASREVIKSISGHSTDEMLEHYSHVETDEKTAVARQIADAIGIDEGDLRVLPRHLNPRKKRVPRVSKSPSEPHAK